MNIGVVKETFPGERRVALVPASLPALLKAGFKVLIESGAGERAGHADQAYESAGATIRATRREVFEAADIIAQVRTAGANPREGGADLDQLRKGQTIVGLSDPLSADAPTRDLAARGVRVLAMELVPRITRAQRMDAMSSQAMISGYKAVLLAANTLTKMFPMFMTAAGTVAPAKVFVIGAGVAGLQAIATAKRLGALVEAYDVRPAVREQVESVGARFLALDLDTKASEDKGGYAKGMDEEFYSAQRKLMAQAVAGTDVVITTAAVPGKKSPILITREMVHAMRPGSVIVDLAAERGGNCEATRPDESVVEKGVTVLGPTNLPAEVPFHASQMYSRNMTELLTYLLKDGALRLDPADEIVREMLVTSDGEVVQRRVREVLGLPAPAMAARAPTGG